LGRRGGFGREGSEFGEYGRPPEVYSIGGRIEVHGRGDIIYCFKPFKLINKGPKN
jgi:hypothetical protein